MRSFFSLRAVVLVVTLAWSSLAFCDEIHDAARSGDLEKVKALLKTNPGLVFSTDNGGDTVLHSAAIYGRKDVVELLLAAKADVNARNNDGVTPLAWAAQEGYKEVAELLLAKGADVNAKDNDGHTPLHRAVPRHKEMAELLLANNSKYDVFEVAALGDLERVKVLLKANPDQVFSKDDEDGWTPLHTAAINDHKDVVKFLVDRGAKVDAKDKNGMTPLLLAIMNNYKDVVELLLASKAGVNARCRNDGRTPLFFAVQGHSKDMVELLLAKGAKINAREDRGWTLLHYAVGGSNDVMELLLAKGAEINARNDYGWTPLHRAAYWGEKRNAECLLAHGADVNAKDHHGKTPLRVAMEDKDIDGESDGDVAELLRQSGGHE